MNKSKKPAFPALFEKALNAHIEKGREYDAIKLVNEFGEKQIELNPKFVEYHKKFSPLGENEFQGGWYEIWMNIYFKQFKNQPDMYPWIFNGKYYKKSGSALKAFFRKYQNRKDQFYSEQKLV